jgi:hypothetical protein
VPIAEVVREETATSTPNPTEEGKYVRDSEAEYTLEYEANCPSCRASLKTLKVIRLLRSRVNFTSTLPRHGRVIICPQCRTVISATLTIA